MNKSYRFPAIVPRLIGTAVMTAVGYGMGCLREHHYKTRDAVIQHYIELHPKDFDHFNDSECLMVILVRFVLGRVNAKFPFSQEVDVRSPRFCYRGIRAARSIPSTTRLVMKNTA